MESVNSDYVLSSTSKLLVVFGASWCKPCKALHPRLLDLEPSYPDIKFVHIDVDATESAKVVQKFGIRGVPALVFLDSETPVASLVGNIENSTIRVALQKLHHRV